MVERYRIFAFTTFYRADSMASPLLLRIPLTNANARGMFPEGVWDTARYAALTTSMQARRHRYEASPRFRQIPR